MNNSSFRAMRREEKEAARLAKLRAEDEAEAAERWRRENEPTDEERMTDRLDDLIKRNENSSFHAQHEIAELAKLLRWHITGSEF